MPFHSIVLVKQVPDTKRITGQAMKEDGTVNRSALPAIFNPEDLNALEMALEVKDRFGGTVTVLTMGPPPAAEVLRESLYRGADRVALLTDRAFAGSDTLATSYVLAKGIEKCGHYDLVFCGRQAIDGDTAQIGPQVAGRLNIPQLTYVQAIVRLSRDSICVRREVEGGTEMVQAPIPALLTVVGTANVPRPPSVKRLMQYKKAKSASEIVRLLNASSTGDDKSAADPQEAIEEIRCKGMLIPEWDIAALGASPQRCGFAGSPTRVVKIDSVVLTATEHKRIEPTEQGLRQLVNELAARHTLD